MSEIVQDNKSEETQNAAQKRAQKYKSSSKVLIFEQSLQKNEIIQQLETKSVKNSFHTGEKLYLQNRDGQLVVNTSKCPHFVLPCIEYTLERENLAAVIKQFDAKFSEDLLNETLDLERKITILDKFELELVTVNRVREDFFVLRFSSTENLTDPGQVVEDSFIDLVKAYKDAFKVDAKFLEYIFLNSVKDIETSDRLLSVIASHNDLEKEGTKQQEMMSKLNLKDFVSEKILQLPLYKKETGFFNHSQYQVLNLETQKLSEPKDVEKPNYLI